LQQTKFDIVLLELGDILNTLFVYWVSNRQLTIITETFKLLIKSCAKFNLFFMNIFSA